MDANVWTAHFFLFLTNLAGFLYQWFREDRMHEWQQENMADLKDKIDKANITCPYRHQCANENCPIMAEEKKV